MTEEKSFDQPQMSKPDIPKEEGVHTTLRKISLKRRKVKTRDCLRAIEP